MSGDGQARPEPAMADELTVVKVRMLDEPISASLIRSESGSTDPQHRKSTAVYSDGCFSITLKHYDGILAELKCPGCAQPMEGPIAMCVTGHSVCAACKDHPKKFDCCPLCQKKYSELRNYSLEAIASKVQFPCKNASKGCTVRLPLQLLQWHKERCGFKPIECFMGKVWDGCSWHGCEREWLDHCVGAHQDKVFSSADLLLSWNYNADAGRCFQLQSVIAYYVIRAYGQFFNLYQIYDQNSRIIVWTVICATKEAKLSARYAFELELYSPNDSWKLLVQRFPCHSELEPDFLKDGNCSKIPIAEAMRFMTDEKVLYYRVRIIEVTPSRSRSLGVLNTVSTSPPLLPLDYNRTRIENANLKAIPEDNIIVRKPPGVNGFPGHVPRPVRAGNRDNAYDDDGDYNDDDDDEVFYRDNRSVPVKATSTPVLSRAVLSNPVSKPPRTAGGPPAPAEQQLVTVKLIERQDSVRMQPIYPARRLLKDAGDTSARSSTESLTKPPKGAGLSKFYNVTMYKAAKFLDRKSIK